MYSGAKFRYRSDILDASSKTLETVCKLDIGGTLPELQHEFCGLWNQLVDTAQTDPSLTTHSPARWCSRTFTSCTSLCTKTRVHPTGRPWELGPTAFYSTTDDPDLVLNNPNSCPLCTNDGHRPSVLILDLQFDEPIPDAPGGDVTLNILRVPSFVYPPAPSTYTAPCHPYPAPDPT